MAAKSAKASSPQALVPDIIARLRLDDFDALPHTDYMHLVELALPQIEAARA
ncbi:hypothetical protein [Phenylobacterium sp.]|uniref:hypothetical protein n=1 Tax=Phenylobacterium sp. TaxID=1871053 RepID=UPI0025E27229|nr:hypothetical protein [Phenylobacterium sp.]